MLGSRPSPAGGSAIDTTDLTPEPETPEPADLGEHVTVLRDEARGRTYWLVGTAHVSQESVREVERVIDEVRPDTVAVELCRTRFEALTSQDRWAKLDIFDVIRQGKTLLLLANLAVGAYQRRLGAELGIKPGAELLAAARKAESVGAHVELADREIQTTLRRTWGSIGFWEKSKLLSALLYAGVFGEEVDQETIERLKGKAALSDMLAEFARAFPKVKKPLIDERDEYLMGAVESAPGSRIVAVVGAAHVPGMVARFGKPSDRAALETVPPPSGWGTFWKWFLPALVLSTFGFAWMEIGDATIEELIYAWIVPNAVAAAVLTAAAGAKLLSTVCAAVVSPITSLHPLIGAGMVVGFLEAWLRKPTVADAERISEDVQSLRGIYRNAFTRVLLVAVLSTVGSALGAWIGATWMVSLIT